MKKHDEGYVLAFVMVVIVVLCLVAVSLMTAATRNIQAQGDSIQRMQDKYAAQGAIEKVISVIDMEMMIHQGVSLESSLESFLDDYITVSQFEKTGESGTINDFSATLHIIVEPEDSSAKVEATLEWKAAVETVVTDEGAFYRITTTELNYTDYQISTVRTGEEAGA